MDLWYQCGFLAMVDNTVNSVQGIRIVPEQGGSVKAQEERTLTYGVNGQAVQISMSWEGGRVISLGKKFTKYNAPSQ